MAKLKLQAEVLNALEHNEMLPFSDAQRKMVGFIKSGQNHWLIHENERELRIATVATIVHDLQQSFEDVARALILVPTSEIADEYAELFEALGKHTDLRVWTAYEGPKILQQKEDIYFGADVVIATPKRLNDLLNIEGFNSASVQSLILDTTDQLLKVGNTAFTQRISDSIPPKQRIALSRDTERGIGNYMSVYCFPYEKTSLISPQ